MGIKDTGDYLTARAANPRTGLISPSVLTAQTPRTPMTPGEAILLYSHSQHEQSPKTSKPGLSPQHARQIHGSPPSRWKQHDQGWFMETVAEGASPKVTTANSSASRVIATSPDDLFVVPMPSAREPQPYRNPEDPAAHTAAQIAALEHYKEKSNRISQSTKQGLSGRMLSVGAGPRKFAAASQRLRDHSSPSHDAVDDGDHPSRTCLRVCSPAPRTYTPFQYSRTPSSGSVDSVATAMKDMPGGFDTVSRTGAQGHGQKRISRKPIGTPPRKQKRRDSIATVATATSAEEKEVMTGPIPTFTPGPRARENSNENRFQDLRQLPRVRIVHYDHHAVAPHIPPLIEADSQPLALAAPNKRIFTLPPDGAEPLPYPCDSLMPAGPDLTAAAETTATATATATEPKPFVEPLAISSFLAFLTSLPARCPTPTWKPRLHSRKAGLLQALNVLTDEKAAPLERLNACKTLFVKGVKAMALLGVMIALVRICLVLWQVVAIVVWPIGVVVSILRWVFSGAS